MSHHATNWAIQQRGLKPATKIVLWHLCDRHNPDEGCFPSQDRLAHDCEISRSALNEHLKILEAKGLLRREQRLDPRTKRQLSTRYVFAFEPDFTQPQDVVGPCPESEHGAVSGKSPEPCPEKSNFRVRNPDTNPVKEPVREPRSAHARAGGGDFDILWDGWREENRPDHRETAVRLFDNLSPEGQRKALSGSVPFQKAMALGGKRAKMITYLRDRLFLDFHDDPEIDKDGDFVIRPGQPEWSEWLGAIRRQHGADAVERVARGKIIVRKQRWPTPELVSA
ncbi:helix-turn-helix domain-containing protein [Chelativorans sp. AA-79]|uniref:helix-turn-helix domain-containing protein n=1 Tax=Chelativorans sp. AA-79 TaxID=3028735 RepID=UPI0023F68537|nr:helix-turn-helix domain-containing protein [Chelativorans sp. AA-79]WEX10321.1 helix-turn-helix domain-containing protein [Chelativorans sp. AA-79]